jgi:hypothetical protein
MSTGIGNEKFGRRTWVRLWTEEWLSGTTRYEMTGAQRAFWLDLLAMAGRSRQPGVVCAGESGERIVGYPIAQFQALDPSGELDIPVTLQLFEKCEKIRIKITQEAPVKLLTIEIVNWSKYQSNLAAQAKRSRKYRASRDASRDRHAGKSRGVTPVEAETEVERRGSATAASLNECWKVLGVSQPIGWPQFQFEWQEFYKQHRDLPVVQVTEDFIQHRQARAQKIPRPFYDAKHKLEEKSTTEKRDGNTVPELVAE